MMEDLYPIKILRNAAGGYVYSFDGEPYITKGCVGSAQEHE